MQKKPCRVCKEVKRLDNFHSDSTRSDGRSNRCKECAAIAAKKLRERKRNLKKISSPVIKEKKKKDRESILREMAADSAYL